ncbi:MAG: sigma-70 family RNA polymerase sigma factor [Prevotellaceae bacterium]|jgi:RNA polymerase sigma factor (sigma-70 family)|nr:sigma-70 family RNA polymerase sigma factor [Prevotellaceae bacterium]
MENNELINELYEKYYKYLLYIAKQIIPEADAEDIVQNVFLNLAKSPDWLAKCILKADSPDDLRRILRTFLHNACYNYHKHSNINNDIFINMPDYESCEISTDVEQMYDDRDLYEYIITVLNKLKGRNKNIFMKYYIDGYSTDELAKQTGLSPRTIETYIYRTLEYMRKFLKEYNIFF